MSTHKKLLDYISSAKYQGVLPSSTLYEKLYVHEVYMHMQLVFHMWLTHTHIYIYLFFYKKVHMNIYPFKVLMSECTSFPTQKQLTVKVRHNLMLFFSNKIVRS